MEERPKTFLLTLLGTSPGVITELLWHLVHIEQREVIGLEVWTTAHTSKPAGARTLGDKLWMFRHLQEALGGEAVHLPAIPTEPPEVSTPPVERWRGTPFRLVSPLRADGSWMADIRDPDDAERFSELLHERVRDLRDLNVELVGGMAGGRKTMSAALQSAFTLHAHPTARLLHVLVHPTVEAHLKEEGKLEHFAVPTKELVDKTKIPLRDQLKVYEVPFLSFRSFLVGSEAESAFEGPHAQLSQKFREAAKGDPEATLLQEEPDTWTLVLRRGPFVVDRVALTEERAMIYRGLMAQPDGISSEALLEWINSQGAKPPKKTSLDKSLGRLRDRIEKKGWPFRCFAPSQEERGGPWHLERLPRLQSYNDES